MEAAKELEIPEEDLKLIEKDKNKGVGSFLKNKAFPALKKMGKDWAEKNRKENEKQRAERLWK